MLQILILCTGNTCRSPMAQALLRQHIEKAGLLAEFTVKSAGLAAFPGQAASAGAFTAMRSRGIDMSRHVSRALTEEELQSANLVLTMTEGHKSRLLQLFPKARGKVYTLAEYAGKAQDITDPFGGDLTEYERCANCLEGLIGKVWEKLLTGAGKKP